jgi:photosystem II stability/assembly factor-like uncharacterized protein
MNGTILTTTNGGETWTVVPAGSLPSLNSVASPDSVNLIVCGRNGLLFTADFGFNDVDTIESGTHVDLNKIIFLNRSVGFCLGDDQLVLKTTDGGAHWIAGTSGYPGNLTDLSFINDSLGYMAGNFYAPFSSYSGTLFITRDQGSSWSLVDSLMFTPNAICFTDSLTGFIASFDILKTTDGGESWMADTQPEYSFTDICFQDKQTGWAITYDGNLVKTTDGGNSWAWITWNINTNHILRLNCDHLLTYGTGGEIWLSRDGGQQGTPTGEGDRNTLRVIGFVDENRGFILGDSVLYRTTDAGLNWQMENHNAGNIDNAAFANKDRCLALTWRGTWLTTDGCRSWHQVNVSLPRAVYGCAFSDEKTAYITGVEYGHFFSYSVVMKSTDGGETWATDSLPGKPVIKKMLFMADGTGFAMGYTAGLYKTPDAGKSWEQITGIPVGTVFRNMTFPAKETGFAIGVYKDSATRPYNVICKTIDGGNQWSQVFMEDTSFRPEFSGVYFVTETTGYVAASEGYILKTADGGATWTRDFSTNALYAIGGTGDRVWAIGANGTILANKTDSGLGVPVSLSGDSLITRLYPNPFAQQVEIGLETDKAGPVRITVTDFTGRRQHDETRILPAGVSSWSFNGSDLAPGVYILTVRSGSRVSSARMVKIGL